MSTATPAAGNAPAASAPAAPVEPTIDQLSIDLKGMSVAQANHLLGDFPARKADPVVVPPVEPPVTPPAQVAPEPTPTPPGEGEPANDPTKIPRFRVEPTNFQDAEVLRLVAKSQAEARANPEAKVLTLQEAMAKVYGQSPATPTKDPKAEPPKPADPAAEINAQIAAKEQAFKDFDAKIEKAYEEMDLKKVRELGREQDRTEREIERLRDKAASVVEQAQRQAEQSVAQTFQQKEKASTSDLFKEYPVLGDKLSPERQAFDKFIQEKSEDPDYAGVFDSPQWPKLMGREFAEARALNRAAAPNTANKPVLPAVTQTPAAPPTVTPAAARATAATVITPGAGGNSTFTPTAEQLQRDIASGKFKAADLDRMLAGTPAR